LPSPAQTERKTLSLVTPSGLRATFDERGVTLVHPEIAGSFGVSARALRRGEVMRALPAGQVSMADGRVTRDRGHGLTEWWVEHAGRLEVGWTLSTRPLGEGPGPLALPLDLGGRSFRIVGGTLVLEHEGRFLASLEGLSARDADGRLMPSRYEVLADGTPAVVVDDREATYPLVIDPVLGILTSLVPSTPSGQYGARVAIDGNVAAVTANGAAYVYRRTGSTWALEQKLTSARSNYSRQLSLSGNALVVGDLLYDHTSGTWVEVATLPSIESALSGTTLVVANAAVSPTHLVIYTRGSSGWASAGTLATGIPTHVALAGTTLAVATKSSSGDAIGAVKIYNGSGTSWATGPVFTPTGTDGYFGEAVSDGFGPTRGVAVVGDTLACLGTNTVTGDWAVYLGSPSGGSLQRMAVGKSAISAVTVASGVAVVGEFSFDLGAKTDTGQIRVFSRAGSTWSEKTTLTSPIPFNYDYFGRSVALSGEDLLIGSDGYTKGGSVSPGGMAFELVPVVAWPDAHACVSDGQCASNHCVDGVCCNTACTESCKACNLPSSTGACTSVPADSMPVGARLCAPAKRCAAGGVCASTCGSVTDCAAGGACIGGVCTGKRGNGSPCATITDCTSGFCVDGLCCDTACTSQCMACDVPTKQGSCWNVTGAVHPSSGLRKACAGAGVGTECTPACNGIDGSACHYAVAGSVACGADKCDSTTLIETRKGTCDGGGACSGGSVLCGAYTCGATTCKTSCTTGTDCAPGYVCGGGLCKAISSFGASCSGPTDCESPLSCVNGVCCGASSCPTGSRCDLPGSKGTCRKDFGTACTSDLECSAGKTCSDGVCCDKACKGVCEACDAPGKAGTCVPIAGPPRATREACPLGKDLCGNKQCDGNVRTTCDAYATTKGTECKPSACVEGGVQPKGSCDGAGTCLTPAVQKCGNYLCADGACRTSCAKTDECAPGFVCGPDGTCIDGARCSDDGTATIAKDGSVRPCAPYRCGPAGVCLKRCESSTECGSGAACDLADHSCQPVATSESDGGCGVASRSTETGFGLIAATLGLGLVGRRRRRRW